MYQILPMPCEGSRLAERLEGGALLPSQKDLDFGIHPLELSFPLRRLVPIVGLITASPLSYLILQFSGLPQRLYSPSPPRSVRPRSSRFKKMPQGIRLTQPPEGCLRPMTRTAEAALPQDVYARQTKKLPAYCCDTSA